MNRTPIILKHHAWLLLAAFLAVTGCKPQNTAPEPLSAEQIPVEVHKAFAKAQPATRQEIDAMLEALQSKDYPGAYKEGQSISASPEITKQESLVMARALLGINVLLQAASAQGDQDAAAFISYQRRSH